jgi:hypothetical protein
MKNLALILWLLAYSVLPAGLALFAVIFAWEGLASIKAHPENLLLGGSAALFLIAWPLSALAGWVLLFAGRIRAAWLTTLATALGLFGLWVCGLAWAFVAAGSRR